MPTGFSLTLYTEGMAGDCVLGPLVQFSSLYRVFYRALKFVSCSDSVGL